MISNTPDSAERRPEIQSEDISGVWFPSLQLRIHPQQVRLCVVVKNMKRIETILYGVYRNSRLSREMWAFLLRTISRNFKRLENIAKKNLHSQFFGEAYQRNSIQNIE